VPETSVLISSGRPSYPTAAERRQQISTGLANSSIARIFPISPARKPPYRAQQEPKQAAYRVLLDVEL